VLTRFEPTLEVSVEEPLAHDELITLMEHHLPAGTVACAVRIDGAFDLVHARSVPRHEPPYRPLSEVVGAQTVFDLRDVEGTVVGFRFPDYSEGLEVSGYHLHFITVDGTRGDHVLEAQTQRATVRIDVSTDLHLELPPGVELSSAHASRQLHQALERAEHSG
jgi:acetolactate decarboxylase